VYLKRRNFYSVGAYAKSGYGYKSELSKYPTEIIREWDNDGIWHTILGRVREK